MRLLQMIGKLVRQYDASLRAAPASLSAQIFARHRRDLVGIADRLAGNLSRLHAVQGPADAANEGNDRLPAFAMTTIWHDAAAFRRRLRLLRYLHTHIAQLLAESAAEPHPDRPLLAELMAATRLHLWDLAQLEADMTAGIGAFPYCSEAKLDGMIDGQGRAMPGRSAGAEADAVLPEMIAREDSAVTRKGGLPAWQLRRINSIVEAVPGQQISVPDLAQQIGLSPSHFTRAFKVSTGTSPARWLLQKRLDFAKLLLLESDRSLAEIATTCGFSEPSHFTKRFRQLVGATPGVWRRQHK